jgi:hypothetical protein
MTTKRSGFKNSNGSADGKTADLLTAEDESALLDLLAQGHSPAVVRRRLLEERGLSVSRDTLNAYRKTHAAKIARRQEVWRKKLRGKPFAHLRDRIEEYSRMYGAAVRESYCEICAACLGRGHVRTQKRERICRACKGKKVVLPPDIRAYIKTLKGDVRLATMPGWPPNLSSRLIRRLCGILGKIRKEVGDAWSRDRDAKEREGTIDMRSPKTTDGTRAEMELLAEVLKAPPEKICAIYEARSAARSFTPSGGEARCPQCGALVNV